MKQVRDADFMQLKWQISQHFCHTPEIRRFDVKPSIIRHFALTDCPVTDSAGNAVFEHRKKLHLLTSIHHTYQRMDVSDYSATHLHQTSNLYIQQSNY